LHIVALFFFFSKQLFSNRWVFHDFLSNRRVVWFGESAFLVNVDLFAHSNEFLRQVMGSSRFGVRVKIGMRERLENKKRRKEGKERVCQVLGVTTANNLRRSESLAGLEF
jgi:hypothetical protein